MDVHNRFDSFAIKLDIETATYSSFFSIFCLFWRKKKPIKQSTFWLNTRQRNLENSNLESVKLCCSVIFNFGKPIFFHTFQGFMCTLKIPKLEFEFSDAPQVLSILGNPYRDAVTWVGFNTSGIWEFS